MPSPPVLEPLQKLVAASALLREGYTTILAAIAEIQENGTLETTGYPRLSMLVADLACLNPRSASRLIAHADAIAEETTPTGHVTPARLPIVREAILDGALDAERVEAILRTIKKIPTWADGDTVDLVERHLVDVAKDAPAVTIAKHGEALLARIDQDGIQPADDGLAEPKNAFRYRRDDKGWMHFSGVVEPESAEELDAMLGALAKPSGLGDDRTAVQRLGDAFCDVIHHAIDSPTLPVRGGEKPHLNITMNYTHLANQIGTATLEGGAPLSAKAARRIACDAGIIPMVMNGSSVAMDAGRTRRLVTAKQRAILIARDRGCAFPNCHQPARWTDAHHIKHWLDGGATNPDNLVLLCRRHHRMIHHSEWEVVMNGSGIPEFLPPRWIDPDRVPRRNLLHKAEITRVRRQ